MNLKLEGKAKKREVKYAIRRAKRDSWRNYYARVEVSAETSRLRKIQSSINKFLDCNGLTTAGLKLAQRRLNFSILIFQGVSPLEARLSIKLQHHRLGTTLP